MSPAVGQTMDPDIHPTRFNQPSSLPQSHDICNTFNVHRVSGTRTVHGTCNM